MTKYTINELANSKGVSPLVREALLQMEAELDATNRQVEILSDALAESRRQRQWVGLTDEEVYPLANEHLHYQMEGYEVSGIYNLARAIEAKLKEKNNE
jgi:hypothetical protein